MEAIAAVLGLILFIGVIPARGSDAKDVQSSLNYKEILQCGPNSLFMFLILSGRPEVTLEQLHDIPISSDGVSLAALREVAKRFRVETEIRHYSPEEIDRVPLPAIGQFNTSKSSITPLHFDVIYKVDKVFVYLLNGTTGEQYAIRRTKLPQFWMGFAMVSKKPFYSVIFKRTFLMPCIAALLVLDLYIYLSWRRTEKTHLPGNVTKEVEVVK